MDDASYSPAQDKNGKVIYKYNQDLQLTTPKRLLEEFTALETWETSFWENPQGHTLRVGSCLPSENTPIKGVIFYMVGAMEFMENDFETFRDLNNRGYAVISYDPFGQGCSDRAHANHTYTCPKPYPEYGDDAAGILRDIVHPFKEKYAPDGIVVGHGKSQGGNHMLHMLHDHPDHGLDKIVLTSPLIDLPPFAQLRKFGVVLPYARLLEASGAFSKAASPLDKLKSLSSKAPVPLPDFHVKDADFSGSDQGRQTTRNKWIATNPQLANYIVTSQWMREAYKGCTRVQQKEFLDNINDEILIIKGVRDPIVFRPAIKKLHNHLKNSSLLEVDGKHNIYIEDDKTRNQALHVMEEYIDNNWPNIKSLRPSEAAQSDDSILLPLGQPLPDPAL
jgi:lysophospholipase